MKARKNVTLSISEPLLRRFRVYAAARNQSMTSLMTEAIQTMLDQDRQSARTQLRFLERIRHAPDRGTAGSVGWSREELHER